MSKIVLGSIPDELGVKDAVHVPIVALVAGEPLTPGKGFKLNDKGEAVPAENGIGIVDPFREMVAKGDKFWGCIPAKDVSDVKHVWEHKKTVSFEAPKEPAEKCEYFQGFADKLGVSYEALVSACECYVSTGKQLTTTTSKPEKELKFWEVSEIWALWEDISGYTFPVYGDACCPESEYPDELPITWSK